MDGDDDDDDGGESVEGVGGLSALVGETGLRVGGFGLGERWMEESNLYGTKGGGVGGEDGDGDEILKEDAGDGQFDL